MKILVLGGTRFVGRHLVAECLSRGDELSILFRGRSPSPFAGLVQHVMTDRRAPTAEAAAVLAEGWDAVVDTSAYDVDDLRLVLPCLRDVGQYLFVSTCGVYRRDLRHGVLTERSPTILANTAHPTLASATRKLRCERYLNRRLQRNDVPLLVARLGLVIGPHDDSGRLGYWLERALRGGNVLVPMEPGQPLQLLDARDLATALRSLLDQGASGVINVVGEGTTARHVIDTVVTAAGRQATPCWVDEDLAIANGVRPWTQIPLWLPPGSPERALMSVASVRPEMTHLVRRPLDDTIADCLAWHQLSRGWSQRWLDETREQHLLHAWRS